MNSAIPANSCLNSAYELIKTGQTADGMAVLVHGLHVCQRLLNKEWPQFVIHACRTHPIHSLVQEDPLTARAFQKPRGYAGDAETIDLLYKVGPISCTSSI